MKIFITAATVALIGLAATLPSFGKDKKKKEKQQEEQAEKWEKIGGPTAKPAEPAGVTQNIYIITDQERRVIREYCRNTAVTTPRGRTAHKLPPGLAKRIVRNDVPQDWHKKVVVGQVLPEPVFHECAPLPREISVRLPKPPVGTITVAVEGKVVRLLEATREIVDVFDIMKTL
jgi:hypothetical protein